MSRNRTLGEFDGSTDSTADPIQPVQRFHPEPVACPRCGESVEVLWLEGAVAGACERCKEW